MLVNYFPHLQGAFVATERPIYFITFSFQTVPIFYRSFSIFHSFYIFLSVALILYGWVTILKCHLNFLFPIANEVKQMDPQTSVEN